MEPKGSLPHSQVLATCPFPDPAQSIPYPHITLPEHPSCPFFVAEVVPKYQSPRQVFIFRNKTNFYGEELLAPRPTPKLEDHPLSAVRDCLFNIFAATLHIGEGQLAGTCECDNEPSGSMRGISWLAENRLASEEGLCSMEWVSK